MLTPHLSVVVLERLQSIDALLEALEAYEGAVVVISHDRAFCEALRCTHVAYVANGVVSLDERELRPADFNELDRGVSNVDGDSAAAAAASPPRDPAAEKAAREEERKLQKARNAAPKKLEKLFAQIEEGEEEMAKLEADMMAVGADASKALELAEEQAKVQARVDGLYEQAEELEFLLECA